MATSRSLKVAFDRRLRALGAGLTAPLERDAEALHRVRVASRRLRAALPLLDAGAADNRHAVALARRQVRRLTAALGRVREMDVALGIIGALEAGRPALAPGIHTMRDLIERERAAHLGSLRARVSITRLQRVSRLLARAASRADDAAAAGARAVDVRPPATDLIECIDHAGVLYAADRLHDVRIAAKKLRYALELEDEVGGRRTGKWVASIKRVQDILGRLHDLEVVTGYAATIAASPDASGEVRSSARLIMDILAQEIHERHAAYLGSRDILRRIAHAASRRRARTHRGVRVTRAGSALDE